MCKHLLGLVAMTVLACGAWLHGYPKPSPYPVSWEVKFTHGQPKRIVVAAPGEAPKAYWYLTYHVVNDTGKEIAFLPVFTMLTQRDQLIRSERNIPRAVFEQIKAVERIRFLEPTPDVAGRLLVGEDQARDAVAIWPEPEARMGRFSIFVTGLSGEAVILTDDRGEPVKDDQGQPVVLHKTLRLDYHVPGDEVYPQLDKVDFLGSQWVMR